MTLEDDRRRIDDVLLVDDDDNDDDPVPVVLASDVEDDDSSEGSMAARTSLSSKLCDKGRDVERDLPRRAIVDDDEDEVVLLP